MCMKLASMAAKEGQAEKGIMGIYVERIWKFLCLFCRTFWKVGQEDPKRVIHAFKMGSSLTLVSLLYVLEPLFDGVGQNAIWAVMTVVVVLEFTVGLFRHVLCNFSHENFARKGKKGLNFV